MNDQCVFVNTEQNPVKIIRLGYFHVRESLDHKSHVTELCEIFYKHPDAPEYALVSVFNYLSVDVPSALIPAIKQAEQAMQAFRCATKLENYTCEIHNS